MWLVQQAGGAFENQRYENACHRLPSCCPKLLGERAFSGRCTHRVHGRHEERRSGTSHDCCSMEMESISEVNSLLKIERVARALAARRCHLTTLRTESLPNVFKPRTARCHLDEAFVSKFMRLLTSSSFTNLLLESCTRSSTGSSMVHRPLLLLLRVIAFASQSTSSLDVQVVRRSFIFDMTKYTRFSELSGRLDHSRVRWCGHTT